ncbi:MAG: hypothetical protein CMN83_02655 [Spongiibacter sp.]|nr:hypothetical protein [Spongiibacter sp.]|tara:strand:- start:66084 stop:66926 length:843 start_codon:yes stop_codon:yes gene_type:complete
MRPLAEFIMKGRLQAVAVAALGIGTLMFAWVGAAAAALVTLRKGLTEGAFVVMWALLPATAVLVYGQDVGPLCMLLVTALAAWVLRNTRSWANAMAAAVAGGMASAAVLNRFGQDYLSGILEVVQPMLDQLQAQSNGSLPQILTGDIAAVIGSSTVLWSVLALMLARWWQAMLYNPGGFRDEMWSLRLPAGITVLLVAGMLLVSQSGEVYRFWGVMCLLPFIACGLSLLHGVVGRYKLGRTWLVVFYIALLLIGPLWAVLILTAIVDSWIDIRRRLPTAG